MCHLSRSTGLSALFVLLSVAVLSGQSAKDTIIESLTTYQTRLQSVQKQINESNQKILDSQNLIDSLQQQLTNSENSSQIAISNLQQQLAESKELLMKQQEDLALLEKTYSQLLMELNSLKSSYQVYSSTTKICLIIVIGETFYIAGHAFKWW